MGHILLALTIINGIQCLWMWEFHHDASWIALAVAAHGQWIVGSNPTRDQCHWWCQEGHIP